MPLLPVKTQIRKRIWVRQKTDAMTCAVPDCCASRHKASPALIRAEVQRPDRKVGRSDPEVYPLQGLTLPKEAVHVHIRKRPARLTTLLANLASFTEGKSDKEETEGEAIEATQARDKAYAELRALMKELKGVARGALRGKRGLLAKLEL